MVGSHRLTGATSGTVGIGVLHKRSFDQDFKENLLSNW